MDWNEYFFRHVFLAASKSKDPSSKVGAILVKDNVVISEGYNGFPRGVGDFDDRLTNREQKLRYTVHAEHNAILNCARRGVSSVDSILFTTAYPCDQCMKCIIQAGVRSVVCHQTAQDCFYNRESSTNWNDTHNDAKIMAVEAGVRVWYWAGELGIDTLIGGKKVRV